MEFFFTHNNYSVPSVNLWAVGEDEATVREGVAACSFGVMVSLNDEHFLTFSPFWFPLKLLCTAECTRTPWKLDVKAAIPIQTNESA